MFTTMQYNDIFNTCLLMFRVNTLKSRINPNKVKEVSPYSTELAAAPLWRTTS